MYKQIARRPHSFRQEINQFGYPFYFFTLSKSYELPYTPKGNCETLFPLSQIDFSFRLLYHPWTKTDDSKTKVKSVFFLEKHIYHPLGKCESSFLLCSIYLSFRFLVHSGKKIEVLARNLLFFCVCPVSRETL